MAPHALTALEPTPQPSVACVRAIVTVFFCLAIGTTLFRLAIQYRRSQLWWEDMWATISMVCEMVAVPVLWWLGSDVTTLHSTQSAWVVVFWLGNFPLTISLWSARMSLLFSIIRITHPASPLRMAAYLTAGLFAFFCVGLNIQKELGCHLAPLVNQGACKSAIQVGITQICMDVVADILLIALAFVLLRNVRLRKSPRRIICVLFSASILTAMVSILHNVFVLGPGYTLAMITVYVQPAVSLIVCNLPVVVTFFYRQILKREQGKDAEDSYDYTTSSPSTALTNTHSDTSPDNTSDGSGVTQSCPIYSADLTPTILTQPSDTSQHSSTSCPQKSPPFEIT